MEEEINQRPTEGTILLSLLYMFYSKGVCFQ